MFIEERKRKTKRSGKRPWIASPEPVRSARKSAERAEPERDEQREEEQDEDAERARREVDADEQADDDVADRLEEARARRSRRAGRRAAPSRASSVSERRLRKPVWMSRARSVPAFIVAKSAPWMNGTASAKARKESVGKPGSSVEASSPPALTSSRVSGKRSGGIDARRLAQRAHDRAARERADLGGEATLTSARLDRLLGSPASSVARALERASRLGEEDVVERGRVQLEVLDLEALGVEPRTTSASRVTPSRSRTATPCARRRPTRRSGRAPRSTRARSTPSAGTASTVGRPIWAFSSRGVPSATMWPWSMIPTRFGEHVRLLQVLRRQEDGHAVLACEPGDLLPQRGAALRVEPGRRLVEEEDARPVHEREREVEPPLHPARVAASPCGRPPR